MKRLVTTVIFIALAITFYSQEPSTKPSEEEAQFHASVREFLILTGSDKMAEQMMTFVINQFKARSPNVSEEVWDEVLSKFDVNEIIDLVIPIYAKYFSQKDIDELIAFYRTPIGQKFIKVQPSIMQESMTVGQKWGKEKGEEIIKMLESGELKNEPNVEKGT